MWTNVLQFLEWKLPAPPANAAYIQSRCSVSEAIAPWDAKLRRYRWNGKQWQKVESALSARLWNRVLTAAPGSPLWPIRASVSLEVLGLAAQFGEWRHTAVELMALTPHAKQLAEMDPNLFWLCCVAWSKATQSSRRVSDVAIFQMNRVNILKWAMGRHVGAEQLKLLGRINVGERDVPGFQLVRAAICNAPHQDFLCSLKVVHRIVLQQVKALGTSPMTPALASLLRLEPPPDEQQLEAYHQTIQDLYAMAVQQNVDEDERDIAISECKSMAALQVLHDSVMAAQHKACLVTCPTCGGNLGPAQVQTCPQCGGSGKVFQAAPSPPFPAPPVEGNEHIIHLGNASEVIQEGLEMHHCVGSYVPAATGGECFLYKVLEPERSTLQLGVGPGGSVHVVQIKGYCNAVVGKATQDAVRLWLYDAAQKVRRHAA